MKYLRSKCKKAVLISLPVFVVVLVFLEVFLRLTGRTYPVFYTYDERGGALLPNAQGWWLKEGRAFVMINEDGMRDFPHPEIASGKVCRLAFLGDSFTEALSVDITNTYWYVVARMVEAELGLSGGSIESMNFGVSGYSTAQQLITLRTRVAKYNPDMIVLGFFTGNDITENSKILRCDNTVPYFNLVDGALILDDSYLKSREYRFYRQKWVRGLQGLINNSYVLQNLNEVRYNIKFRNLLRIRRNQGIARGLNPQMREPGLCDSIYKEPESAEWKAAWEITERLILEMAAEVRMADKRFMVMTITSGAEVSPSEQARQGLAASLGVTDLDYPEKRLASFCGENGIDILVLGPMMRKHAEDYNVYFHGFSNTAIGTGHWNEKGHAVAGQLLAGKLSEILASDHKSRTEEIK